MTEQEMIRKQQEYGESRFVVSKSGKFYLACSCGAFALARVSGYRVMRRQRKGGKCILTTGFPESRLEQVKAWIAEAGGSVAEVTDAGFVFSGIDGSPDEALVSDECRRKRDSAETDLREMLLSFDLSHSTPMDAMMFIDKLQKMYIRR